MIAGDESNMIDEPGQQPYRFCKGKSISEMLAPANPRHVVVGPRPWMGALALYHSAFSHPYTLGTQPRETYASAVFRLNLLGLAGGNITLALDAALASYYSGCMALERHALDTWRRAAYGRLHPKDIWRWIPRNLWPDDEETGRWGLQGRVRRPEDGSADTSNS